MTGIRILVVYDPTATAQPALARAAALAESAADSSEAQFKLHVYACIYTKIPKSKQKAAQKKALLAAQKDIIRSDVSALVAKGIQVDIEVDWGKDWYQAVVRAADRIGADNVFKSSYKQSPSQRLLKPSSDRTLLRQCDCPVFLVKSEDDMSSSQRIILAAVQFRGEVGAYEELNKKILSFCQRLYSSEAVKVHFINACRRSSRRLSSTKRGCGSAATRNRSGRTARIFSPPRPKACDVS
jgi:universal stress protein E